MRIIFTLHADMIDGAGGATVVRNLVDQLESLGNVVAVDSLSNLSGRLGRLRAPLYPLHLARRLHAESKHFDVIDATTGDAWLYSYISNAHRPLLVTQSHGLEHAAHDALMADVARGGQRVSWKYPLYHGGLRLWEVRQSLTRSDLCLFLSDHNRDYAIEKLAIDPTRCHVVANGCDGYLLDRQPTLATPCDAIGIAMIGSYYAGKGIAYAALALPDLMRRHPGVSITFLGTGCPASQVYADYDPALHHRITVVPRYDRRALPDLLTDCQILLFPSLTEGFPLSLVEGMACGLAPVVSSLPGTVGIVTNDHDALLIAPASAKAISSALERLIAQPETLNRLRFAARRTAEKYRWEDIAAKREGLYREFIDRRTREQTRTR